jgi:hypothetical protein
MQTCQDQEKIASFKSRAVCQGLAAQVKKKLTNHQVIVEIIDSILEMLLRNYAGN